MGIQEIFKDAIQKVREKKSILYLRQVKTDPGGYLEQYRRHVTEIKINIEIINYECASSFERATAQYLQAGDRSNNVGRRKNKRKLSTQAARNEKMVLKSLLQKANLKQGVDKVADAVCDTQVNFLLYMSITEHTSLMICA